MFENFLFLFYCSCSTCYLLVFMILVSESDKNLVDGMRGWKICCCLVYQEKSNLWASSCCCSNQADHGKEISLLRRELMFLRPLTHCHLLYQDCFYFPSPSSSGYYSGHRTRAQTRRVNGREKYREKSSSPTRDEWIGRRNDVTQQPLLYLDFPPPLPVHLLGWFYLPLQ